MDIAHRGLEDYLVGLVLGPQLVYRLDLLLVWALVQDVSDQLVVWSLLWKLLRKNVKAGLFEGCCVNCWVGCSLLSLRG